MELFGVSSNLKFNWDTTSYVHSLSSCSSRAKTRARLADRRAGIEPLIGHAKQGGQLGQSRMKTDDTTLAAGYSAIGGFNLRQLIHHLLTFHRI
jgi:hypothetical protein